MAKTLANYDPLVQIPSGMTPAGADFPIVESHDILVGENDKRLDAKLDDIDSAIGNVGQTPIATQLSSKVNTGDIVTSVAATGSTSNNKIPSETAVRAAIEAKTINVDSTVTQGSTNAVSGGAVHTQLATKQDALTFDTTPTASSSNPVTSGGVKAALDAKQDALTFDTTPTASSSNPVTSGGVKAALDTQLATKQDALTFDTTPTASSSNPVTSGGVKAALDTKQNTLTYETTPIVGSVNPVTSTGIRNAIDAAAAGNLGQMQAAYDTFSANISARVSSLSNGMVACSDISAETTVGDTRILLYTGTTNGTYTNGHWYYNSAASNAAPSWTDGGAVGSAPTIDNTLTVEGAAANSKAVGDAIENIVTISNTQPGSNSGNKVWIRETTNEEVQVPTYEEHIAKANKADIATNNESDNGSGTITASKKYAIGDHFYINNTNTSSENYGVSILYKATAAIASGDAIVVGTNCEASKVADEITSLSNDIGTVKADLNDFESDIYKANLLKLQPKVEYLGNYTIGSNGALSANSNYNAYSVAMNGLESVIVNTANIYGYFNGSLEITDTYRPYTTDGTRHFDASNTELTTDAEYIVCVNLVTSGVVVTARNADDTETVQESIERLESDAREIDDLVEPVFVPYNLSQATKIANHRIRYDKTIEENSVINYYKIPVEEKDVYRVTNIVRTQHCLYCFFDSNDNITYAYPSTNQPNENVLTTETVTIPTDVVYLGINDLTRWQSVSPIVEKQVKQLADEAIPSNILRSPLKGLYLVTAGDSITIGHGIEDSESMADDERPTYGKLAADYYGTRYHNIGMSGRTMADIKVDGVTRNGFAVDRYQLVPDGTDILTIWFGWNDCAHGANSMRDNYCLAEYSNLYSACTTEQKEEADTHDWETAFVGTISSTDKTTWAGAWNFVLEYFTVTKPIEHLGVIIPFLPLGNFAVSMREMLINICKNYGVAYVDSANPNEIPTVAYCDSSRTTNYKNYLAYRTKYTADTLHPNRAGYQRIARGYIPWVARI